MEVKVKALSGEKFTLTLEPSLSVPALKEQLASETGANLAELKVIFKGKVPETQRLPGADADSLSACQR